jgi:murein DD-endopeptidase MepM/ murein hydrolase activator NlpD
MAYTREQRRNIAIAQRLSRGHTPKELEALLMAMAVESNFRHVGYGDRDSLGVLQQRPSQGWGAYNPKDPSEDIQQFLSRSQALVRKGFKGTPGQLAQAIQRSAFPGRYDERAGEVRKLLDASASAMPGGGASTPARATTPPGVSAPDTSAIRNQFALSLIGPQKRPLQERLLELAGGLQAARSASPVPTPGAPRSAPERPEAPGRAGGRAFSSYKVIGTPHSGTHTIGNWQSDNAKDYAMPVGTPIRAPENGVIGSKMGSLGKSGRFAGKRMYLEGSDEHYFAHLSRIVVKPGQRVKAGQIIGYSGMANGVPHLHYGRRNGRP